MQFQTRKQVPAHWTTVTHETILEAIESHGVFTMTQKTPSRWILYDGCDEVNSIELSAMHLRGLAEELIALADKDDALRRARGMTEDDERIFPVMDAPPCD